MNTNKEQYWLRTMKELNAAYTGGEINITGWCDGVAWLVAELAGGES